jgi:hypothetical protein
LPVSFFLAVADHAEYLGAVREAINPNGPFANTEWQKHNLAWFCSTSQGANARLWPDDGQPEVRVEKLNRALTAD